MRRDSSLHGVLDVYRRLSLAGAVLAGLAFALLAGSVAMDFGREPPAALPAAGAGFLLMLIALLWCFGHVALRRQLTEADAERHQVIEMAHRDALTGAFTRSYFLGELRERVHHGSPMPVGYLQLDMDHLKAINDGQGHAAGDAALLHLIATIRQLVPEAVIGRLGGDEFGIALIGQDSRRAALRAGERILAALGKEVRIGDRLLQLSATIGVAMAPGDATDVTELMSHADLALYRGKRLGRSMVIGYDPDMLVDERHSRFVQRELRSALLMNEIKAYYQPIYRADGTTLKSYEALVRWQHPHRGLIPPAQFIPIAEQSDIIDRLGEAMLHQVCADIGRLQVPVAINVSPVQLRRNGFAARVAAILLEHGVGPDRIVLEITENMLMREGGIEAFNLDAMRRLGIRIAIDDLGTGHAGLNYLRSFAFDIIKIDRSYTAQLLTSPVDRMIVTALCDIARALKVEVVAEGVETCEQLLALRQLGCDGVQGYLLGRPAPLEEAVARHYERPSAA